MRGHESLFRLKENILIETNWGWPWCSLTYQRFIPWVLRCFVLLRENSWVSPHPSSNMPFILISTKHLWKLSSRSCNSDKVADSVRQLLNTVLFWNRELWAPRDNQGARDQRESQDLRAPTGCRVSLGRRAKRLDVLSFYVTICSRAATNDYHCYWLICLLFND